MKGFKRTTSVESTAGKHVRQLHGQGAVAWRTTGNPGMSGWFQPYVSDRKIHGLNSVGKPFHVATDGTVSD